MLRFSTAGESHGEALIALVQGLPAGLEVDQTFIDRELWRRQQGYGRGGRMKIEKDTAHIVSGVRHGKTIGSPIAILIANRDWQNWQEKLPVEAGDMYQGQTPGCQAVKLQVSLIVSPSTPVGPGDIKPTPTGQLVLDAAAGRMPAYVDTGLNIVHVDDVANGHLLAYQRGAAGERYILGGQDMEPPPPLLHRSTLSSLAFTDTCATLCT